MKHGKLSEQNVSRGILNVVYVTKQGIVYDAVFSRVTGRCGEYIPVVV